MLSPASIGGALCHQQDPPCKGIESHQHRKSFGSYAVRPATFTYPTADALSEKIYAEGGILSVTSRILVVDLLSSMVGQTTIVH